MTKIDKVIRDGKVAVLISEGYGAGWYTWNKEHEVLLYHPKLVELVEEGRVDEITDEWLKEELNIDYAYLGGTEGLVIVWVPQGAHFVIDEYDGHESLILFDEIDFHLAE